MGNISYVVVRILVLAGLVVVASCETGADTTGAPPGSFTPIEKWWETATPDFSANPDRPVITLSGDSTVFVNLGDPYTDAGAIATDLQDGDLTAQIVVDDQVDTNNAADFLVRYTVTDSSQMEAIEAVRIVRVHDGTPTRLSSRWIGTTASHLGYIEHLPATYSDDPNQNFPLLIYNHGSAVFASLLGENGFSAIAAVGTVVGNAGPTLIINGDNWIASDPYIVLSPQTVDLNFDDPIARLDAFVDFAIATYNVDASRIYVSGWSSGAALSIAYAAVHADRVAAVIPISGGLPLDNTVVLPDGYCDIGDVPMWQFHGEQDDILAAMFSIDNHALVINNCMPPVTPRLTIYLGEGHPVHHGTWNLTMMEGGNFGVSGDPTYDLYDISVFDWLAGHSLQNRGISP